MKNTKSWITVSLVNLCIVALLGVFMRTKFLFPIRFVDYKNLLSAHSHFAFGGWVTLILMVLLLQQFLEPRMRQRKAYRVILWGIQLSAVGMLISFPFEGYGLFAIIFSTIFIFFTYGFTWVFLVDLRKSGVKGPASILVKSALACLVVSSVGPFSLAYMMATNSGNATNFRDSVYTFLHFQYNGFFTLGVFALFFGQNAMRIGERAKKWVNWFVVALTLSIIPSLFLSLLWHFFNPLIRGLSFVGCFLLLLSVLFFVALWASQKDLFSFKNRMAASLLQLSMVAFVLKSILQTGTIIPDLGNAVFGFRPIIIGFLHLVFLGVVTLYIFSHIVGSGSFSTGKLGRTSIVFFTLAVIFNEGILLVNGIGLLFNTTNPIYGWLLWVASILLFAGALLIVATRFGNKPVGPPALPTR